MKIAIYSPYLDTFGGGEKYMMTIAELFASGNTIDVLLDQHLESLGGDYLKDKLAHRFNLNLQSVNFIMAPIGKNSSLFARMLFLKKYDVFFCLTDGSIFYPTAKSNILHIQSPLVGQPAKSLWGKVKLKGWDLAIYNSLFTKKYSESNWPIKSEIIYPPVNIDEMNKFFASQSEPSEKKKYILSVGRFFGYLKDKKHEILINTFKDLYKRNKLLGWSLHLVGSAGEGDQRYLDELTDLAKGAPIKFYPNLDYDKLIQLYGQSCIYWHAAGFEEIDPTKMEHFGISTVEAMAAGCVPVVINKGGQTEIVEKTKSGFLWDTLNDLEGLTIKIVLDEKLRLRMSRESIIRAQIFSKNIFTRKILKLINT